MSEDMLQKIFNKLTDMESKYDAQLEEINTNFEELNKKVAILTENLSAVERKLNKMDTTIDLLSRRSIDQEAELKRIKLTP